MENYKSMIIGHITLDYNTDHLNNTVVSEGGAVIFSSASAHALGHKVCAVTKLNEHDKERLKAFTLDSKDIFPVFSENSCIMQNTYFTADKERRLSVCASKGDPFILSDIPNVEADIYHFAGLVYGDFDNSLITELSAKGKVAVDVQGFLRHVNEIDGQMYFKDWEDKKTMLPFIDYFKTDDAEAKILTGLDDRKEAAKMLYDWGTKEVLITHNSEVTVYDGKKIYTCPIKARNLSGRTGRGDTTFAAYICERGSNDIETSLLYATATVSLKMEKPGPLKCSRKEIKDYIKLMY